MNINWKDSNSRISKYFTVGEVTKGDVIRIPTDPLVIQRILKLAEHLDAVRELWGSPILVTSWYRPPAINRSVGGAKDSRHLYGDAADIKPARGEILQFQTWLDVVWREKALGYGAKRGFVHVDLRPQQLRWNY